MTKTVLQAPLPLALSPKDENYDMTFYLKGALAGGICCGFTHGAVTPVDVVKTRIQLEPQKVRRIRRHFVVVVVVIICGKL